MLISFAVENYLSMRDRQEFSMERVHKYSADKSPVSSPWKRASVSTVAAIYGSNAAGKSTFISALAFLGDAVRNSYRRWEPDEGVPVMPFSLDSGSAEQPTNLDIEFIAEDGVEYQYSVGLSASRVTHEHLYSYRTNRRTILFNREAGSAGDDEWYFGPSFRGPATQIRDTTRDNALFLSAAAAADNAVTRPAYRWLTTALRVYNARHYEHEHSQLIRRLNEGDQRFRDMLTNFLRHADLGVQAVSVVREELDSDRRSELERLIRTVDPDEVASYEEAIKQSEFALSLSHRGEHGEVALPFELESDGTQALLSFASIALKALDSGAVCVVDEIDTSLHPLLVAELVNVFSNPRVNDRQAQLIFTTHDVSLIGRGGGAAKTLERDQVWVVEKGRDGASSITGISEYRSPRKEENLERGYMTGRFGGLPSVSIVQELLRARTSSNNFDDEDQ